MFPRESLVSLSFCGLAAAIAACSSAASDSGCKVQADCAAKTDTPVCVVDTGECIARPAGSALGLSSGQQGTADLVEIGSFPEQSMPSDLEFHPERPRELWVVTYKINTVFVGFDIGTESERWDNKIDPATSHFMNKPPALAMGAGNTWGSCSDQSGGDSEFMGPSLFSADWDAFGVRATDLGSHLDMLHNTQFCRGIAHEEGNVYWVFNSFDKSIDRYNFNVDHGPGNDDHSDGEIYRYAKGEVLGRDGVPSHLAVDPADKSVFIADTGHGRLIRLDPSTATKSGELPRRNEPLKANGVMQGAGIQEIVPAGTLEQPSGLEIFEDTLYVSDHATGHIYAFDKSGTLLKQLDTGLGGGALGGLAIGPEARLYFASMADGKLYRVDPK